MNRLLHNTDTVKHDGMPVLFYIITVQRRTVMAAFAFFVHSVLIEIHWSKLSVIHVLKSHVQLQGGN